MKLKAWFATTPLVLLTLGSIKGQWPSDPGGFECRSDAELHAGGEGPWRSSQSLVRWSASNERLDIWVKTSAFGGDPNREEAWAPRNGSAFEDSLLLHVEAQVPRSVVDKLLQGEWVMQQEYPCQIHYRGLSLGSLLRLGEAMANARQAPGSVPMMLSTYWSLPMGEPVYLAVGLRLHQDWTLTLSRACVNLEE